MNNYINEWATNNKISIQDLDVDDLTEGQLLRLAHSDEMQSAYFRMSQKTNLLENDKVILASSGRTTSGVPLIVLGTRALPSSIIGTFL